MQWLLYLGCPPHERYETEKALAAADLSVIWAENAGGVLAELQRRDLPLLLDLSHGAASLQSAREIRSHRSSTIMFAVVDVRRPDLTIEAVLAGMADVFARPLGGRRVANAIAREIGAHDCPAAPPATADDLYAHSSAMRTVSALIARAATMRAGVLIRGEAGTGRHLTARAIHAGPQGRPRAFVAINCSCETDQLDAELFGKSSRPRNGDLASGLERLSRDSRLYDALGGTLYLQNVVEAPTRTQARLARVLRDREVKLVESGATISCDVRPMAGVDPGFDSAVRDGRVREDLFRRLSVIRIDLPPLRNRREDIPALANYFVRRLCASIGVPPKTLSRAALSLISALPWRGNAVELRTLLENIVVGRQGGRGIGLDDVLSHVKLDGGSVVFSTAGTLKEARARFEREYIKEMLEQHEGRVSDTARALGIQRTNLYRKMRSLRVAKERHS